jgi:hypothetical protein
MHILAERVIKCIIQTALHLHSIKNLNSRNSSSDSAANCLKCAPFNFISNACLIASSSLAKAKANDDDYDDDDDDDDCGAVAVRCQYMSCMCSTQRRDTEASHAHTGACCQYLSCMCSSMRISASGLTRATSVLCHTPLNLQAQTANNKITK